MNVIQLPSPNYNDRENGKDDISALVLHYTGMQNIDEVKDRLCCPKAAVSAHYLIDEQGHIFQLVAEEKRAWHAGVSHWQGRDNVNDFSIGIEIQNNGHEWGYKPFSVPQMQSVIALSQDIINRYNIGFHSVIAHSDIAPTRKQDPGELFDWSWVNENIATNIANIIANKNSENENYTDDYLLIQKNLSKYGYKIQETAEFDEQTKLVITAFQRHFRQANINGKWDSQCNEILSYLISLSS
jgi:N-acetylmuramoyl-L-alanine amidase